ncbi:MAG: hypothetical protein ABIT16_08795 [Croceibacterium sp.]
MSELKRRLIEDQALRDAALDLFKADLGFIRTDLKEKGLGARVADRLGDGTREMLDDSIDYAEENKGKVAAALAAVVLWFARGPIMDGVHHLLGDDDDDAEPGDARGRSVRD